MSVLPVEKATVVAPRGGRRVFVIHNPVAGWRPRRRLLMALKALARAGVVTTLETTSRRGDAEMLARRLEPGHYDVLAVAGGDGTINEVANGLQPGGPPLGLIPMGTANVLAAEIGLEPRARDVDAAIATGEARNIHAGRVNGRRFLMMAGIGFDARVVARIDPRLKRRLGRAAYVVESLREIARLRPLIFTFLLDGVPYQAAAAVVANGHFYGGRMICAPEARLTDACFQVCLFEHGGRWNVLRYATALCLGRLHRLRDVRVVAARRVEIAGPAGEPVQADGDIVAYLPAIIEIEENALSLVAPGVF